ncbi:MAG: hypothetical protein AAF456_16875 [Planctomycetota bacterium]
MGLPDLRPEKQQSGVDIGIPGGKVGKICQLSGYCRIVNDWGLFFDAFGNLGVKLTQ